jgi:hypothetical protein
MAMRAVQMALARPATDQRPAYTKRTRYEQMRTTLMTERSSFDAHWKECADFIRPRRAKFQISDKNRGDRRNQNIIDSTATFSSRTLSSGLHAGMSSPARPWFKSTIADPDLARYKPVQSYLAEVTTRMQAFYSMANLYQALPVVYGDLGDFGTGAMAVLPDAKDLFRVKAYPIGSYAIGLDARGRVTTFLRDYSLSVMQLIEEFGIRDGFQDIDWSKFSSSVKNLWDRGQYEEQIPVTWVVTPNVDYQVGSPRAQFMKWTSCYFERGQNGNTFLRESGYKTFPIMVPRWDVTDEDNYGTDWPASIALGDIKGLQTMHREKAKAIVKQVTPPMVGSWELKTQKTSVLPGEVTYTRDPQHGFRAAYQVNLDIGDLRADIGEVQQRIQRAYFEDLFLMLARTDAMENDPAKTATEIAERKEEKMLALGPVLERSNDELFDPLYDRVFEMADEAGLLPDPPDELQGVEIKPENTSILAQAQKLVGVNAADRLVTTVASMVQVWPEARHKVNAMRVVDDYGDMYGTDPDALRTDDEAQALADAEAKQAAAAQAAESAPKVASAAQMASQTPLATGGTVLDQLTGGGAPT